jgi:hexosaminidase
MLVDDRARPRRGRGGVLGVRVGSRVLGSLGALGLMAAGLGGVLLLGSPAGAAPVQPPPQVPTPTVTERIPAPAPTVTVTRRPPTVTATEAPPTVTETAPAPTVTVTATATVSQPPPVATARPNPTTTVTMTETPETRKPSRTPSATASPGEPDRTVPAGATSPAPPGPHAGASALAGAAVALVAAGGVYAACRAVVYLRRAAPG